MGFSALKPNAMLTKVAMAYPNVPTSNAGTIELRQPFAAAMPAAVVGPAASDTVLQSYQHN